MTVINLSCENAYIKLTKLLSAVGKQITTRNVKRDKPPRENTTYVYKMRRKIINISVSHFKLSIYPIVLSSVQ